MTYRRACQLVVVSLLVGPAAHGQMAQPNGSTRPIQVIVSGGLTLPSGDLKNFHDSGFHYDASVLLSFAGVPVTLRPELSMTRFSLKESATAAGSSGDVTQMLGALGNLEFALGGGLYALAGGGLLNLKTPSSATSGADISQSKFTFDAGAGYRFQMGGIRGFVEGRMGTASYDQGKVGFAKATFIPITFGLVF